MRLKVVALAIVLAALGAGCAKDTGTAGDAGESRPGRSGRPSGTATETTTRTAQAPAEAVVHFDFDSAELDRSDIAVADRWARFLSANPELRVTLTGHCDERGTREYNTGLGERRAMAVREHLIASGVRGDQISVLSLGEEKPVAHGHDEESWRQNRRVEISPR